MERIYLSSPHMSEAGYEQNFIQEAFDTNWIAPLGANVDGFELEFAQKVGANYAVAMTSGTSAIHIALKLADVKEGDKVFCQSLTFSATANPIIYEKAVPVFIDSEEETWNMCPVELEQAFQKYPDTKAVILVHLYGLPGKVQEISDICKKYGAVFIEDAAESLGSTYQGKYTGTFGDFGIYSFNGNKIITTSGGGMLVTKTKEQAEKVKFWITQSRETARHYEHKELGYNYRMSNVLAGIGRGQLQVLEQRVKKKREIFACYQRELQDLEGVTMMPDLQESNFWLSCLTLTGKVKPLDVMKVLEQENIESRPLWKPMHLQPFFQEYEYVGGRVAKKLFEAGVCLPSDSKLTEQQQMKICELVKGLWK